MIMRKTAIIFSLLFFIGSIVTAQDVGLLSKKIIIEQSIKDKVEFAINKIINKEYYVVVVNAELVKPKPQQPKEEVQQEELKPDLKEDTKPYAPIPGLPAIPTLTTAQADSEVDTGKDLIITKQTQETTVLGRIDIAIYIEEAKATASTIKNIGVLIRDVVPQVASCNDCIRFETMNLKETTNLATSENQTISQLIEQIETLERAKREEIQERKERELELLQIKLKQEEDSRKQWEDDARAREYRRDQADSTRLSNFEIEEKDRQRKRDSLLVVRDFEVKQINDKRIEELQYTNQRSFDLLENQIKKTPLNSTNIDTAPADQSLLSIDKGLSTGAFPWLTIIIIILVVAIIGTLLFLAFRNPSVKPVYLRPKKQAEEEPNKTPSENKSQKPQPEFTKTNVNQDEDVMRTEINSMRQSAVTMSVGQKESASNIIKDWLNEGEEKSESPTEGEK
jgi:hypothetical protein